MSRRGRRIIADQRGVALLELLISLTIFGMLLPVIAGELMSVTDIWSRTTDRLEARALAVSLLREIESEVQAGRGFAVQQDGTLAFLNKRGRLVRYQFTKSGLLMRDEEGVGVMVVGAKITTCRFDSESSGTLLHLELTTKVGNSEVTLSELWTGRGTSS